MSGAGRAAASNPMRYSVYGVTLLSQVALPELDQAPETQAATTRAIRFSLRREPFSSPCRQVTSWALPTGEPWLTCAKCEGGYALRFADLADFGVDQHGNDITARPLGELSAETLSHLLLDHVLPLVLNLRGQDALHATAVLTPYGVCAFTGPTGMGKSTLAAAFHRAGDPIFSDDCLALQPHPQALAAIPAYPGLRLWTDSLTALGIADDATQPVAHYTSKQRLATPNRLDHAPETARRLAAVYSLRRRPAEPGCRPMRNERLSRRDAVMELLPHLFRMDVTDRHMLARQFDLLAQLVACTPVRRLHVPSSFDALDHIRDAILSDLRQTPRAPQQPF